MGYCSSSEYALIVLFSPSFHRPQPRRTKFLFLSCMLAKSRWPGRWDPVFDSMVQHKHSILFVGPANIKYLNRQGELSFKGSLLSQHSTLSLFYSTTHLMLFDYILCAAFIPVLEDKCLPSGCKQWPMKYLRCCLYAHKQQCEKAECHAVVKLSLKGGL